MIRKQPSVHTLPYLVSSIVDRTLVGHVRCLVHVVHASVLDNATWQQHQHHMRRGPSKWWSCRVDTGQSGTLGVEQSHNTKKKTTSERLSSRVGVQNVSAFHLSYTDVRSMITWCHSHGSKFYVS